RGRRPQRPSVRSARRGVLPARLRDPRRRPEGPRASAAAAGDLVARREGAVSLDLVIAEAVAAGVKKALADIEAEPLVYTVPAAARALRVSPDTVRDLIADGLLPTVPHMGR